MMSTKAEHNWLKVSLILGTCLIYTITVGLNILATVGSSQTLFKLSTGNVSDKYSIEITPAGWVFSIIWTVILILQFLWLIYTLICIFRQTTDGDSVYRRLDFIQYATLISFAVNNAAVIAWLFVWDTTNEALKSSDSKWSLFLIVIATFGLEVALFISFRHDFKLKEEMIKLGLNKDVWLNKLQNDISFFLTWLSLASNLNFAVYLTFESGVKVDISSTVALIIILVVIIFYFVLENFIWQRFLLYLFTPWIVLIITLSGSVSNYWNSQSPTRSNIITLILLIVVILMTIAKITIFVPYHTVLKHKVNRRLCHRSDEPHLIEDNYSKINNLSI